MTSIADSPALDEIDADHIDQIDDKEGLVATLSPGRLAWKRYWRHRGAAISTVIILLVAIMAFLAPITARYGIDESVMSVAEAKERNLNEGTNINMPPGSYAWFGTDDIGRDMYTRLLYGMRTSIIIGIASAILSVVIGTAVGAFAGLRGGKFDDVMMRVTDLFLAFPFLVLVILIREFLGGLTWLEPLIGDKGSIRFIIVLFAIFGWMGVARLVRGQVLALKEREFIEASRAAGASNRRIVRAHLLPNSIGPILVALTLSVIGAIVGESTLSFFGFGPQPGENSTSLGNLIGLSRKGVQQGNWWLVVYPCGALVLLAICISFVGDGLRDAFDPKLDNGR